MANPTMHLEIDVEMQHNARYEAENTIPILHMEELVTVSLEDFIDMAKALDEADIRYAV